ncbi:winged helix-turn-helix transcriptional regulator [Hyphococcus sp.]|uniref:winged helix-turn-helix transcriptional regulator n=1 Tax=Hyphococcus sp. TaxID=2038636 RepID=UPI0035C6EA16
MALKIRKNQSPPAPYDCPLSECLSIIGGAWTPNILWNLSAGARRFSELRHDMPKISAKMLTTRLKELEEKGIVERSVLPTSPPSVEYALTREGRELLPAIEAIAAVGRKLKRRRKKAA